MWSKEAWPQVLGGMRERRFQNSRLQFPHSLDNIDQNVMQAWELEIGGLIVAGVVRKKSPDA